MSITNESNSHVAFLCTTQELGPRYAGLAANETLYELVVAPAAYFADTSTAAAAEFLAALTWFRRADEPVRKLRVAIEFAPAAGQPDFEYVDVDVFAPEADAARSTGVEALRSHLDGVLGSRGSDAAVPLAGFAWAPAGQAQSAIPGGVETFPRGRLSHLLSSVGALPAPLPQGLSLSFLFKVTSTRTVQRVFAAPIFGAWSPAEAASSFESDGTNARWKYAAAAGKPLAHAYCGSYSTPAAPASSDQRIDMRTQWIGVKSAFDSDWTAQLRPHVETYFDLPQRVIDALRALGEAGGGIATPSDSIDRSRLSWLREMLVMSLRDLAGGGAVRKVFEDAQRAASPVDPADPTSAAADILASFELAMDSAKWRSLLVVASPELAGLDVLLAPTPTTPRTWKEELEEFERLQAAVRDARVARRIVFQSWDAALKSSSVADWWSKRQQALRDALDRLDVASICGRPLVAPVWRAIVDIQDDAATASERERLGANVAAALDEYFTEWLPAAPQAPLPADRRRWPSKPIQVPAPSASFRDALRDKIKSAARTHIVRWIESFEAQPADAEFRASPRPHALSFQIDRLGARAKSAPGATTTGNDDLLRRVGGVVALMRPSRGGDGSWRYLNVARVQLGAEPSALELQPRALVPARMAYRDGMRQVLMTYDNQPIVARSPLSSTSAEYIASAGGAEAGSTPTSDDGWLPVRYAPLQVDPDDATKWARLPMLKFGESYELAAFVMTNGGALPAELAASTQDGAGVDPLRAKNPEDIRDADVPEAVRLGSVLYQRRVPVSSPRVDRGVLSDPRPALPLIPENTKPLARELNLPGGASQGGTPSQNGSASKGDRLPLLLLGDPDEFELAMGEYELRVRPPSVDLETWDRWIAKDATPTTIQLRKDVRREHIRLLAANARQEAAGSPADKLVDVSIDDPAVESTLLVELVGLVPDVASISERAEVAMPAATGRALPASVQRGAVSVHIVLDAKSSGARLAPGAAAGELVARVRPGEIFELRVFSLVQAAHFGGAALDPRDVGRFPASYASSAPTYTDAAGVEHRLMTPMRMLVEAATTQLPSPEEMWESFTPALAGDRVEIALAKSSPAFAFLRQVEVRRQLWRWDGRPTRWGSANLQSFPAQETQRDPIKGQPATQTMAWETWAFSERGDFDYSQHSHELNALRTQSEVVYTEPLEPAAPARFYRFRLIGTSRYAGLRPVKSPPIVESTFGPGTSLETHWRRLFAPCQRSAPTTRPRVKIVVPLTESERHADLDALHSAGLAPLMVVLDEPWFEEGGLGEELEAQIVVTPFAPPGQPSRDWHEYGSDPILAPAPAPEPWEDAPQLDVIGPLGTTFDTGADAPRFVTTMFVIRPNFAAGAPKRAPVWPMAKIRFQRSIASAANPQARASEWTDGFWTQFLPDSRRLEAWNVEPQAELKWSTDANGALALSGPGLRRAAPQPDDAPGSRFSRLLLVTRVVHDAQGRIGDESYVGVFRADSPSIATAVDSSREARSDSKPIGPARVRVLELQWSDADPLARDPQAGRSLWSSLFEGVDEADGDLRARIVRVTAYTEANLA